MQLKKKKKRFEVVNCLHEDFVRFKNQHASY